jgi:hypothetical protein
MISKKNYSNPLGQGVPKTDDELDGSLEEALIQAQGVSGITKQTTTGPVPAWGSAASTEGQFQEETQWRKSGTSIKVFDLSKDEHLANYSDLVSKAYQDDPSVIIVDEDKQFCKTTENWKILVQVVEIEYKKKI